MPASALSPRFTIDTRNFDQSLINQSEVMNVLLARVAAAFRLLLVNAELTSNSLRSAAMDCIGFVNHIKNLMRMCRSYFVRIRNDKSFDTVDVEKECLDMRVFLSLSPNHLFDDLFPREMPNSRVTCFTPLTSASDSVPTPSIIENKDKIPPFSSFFDSSGHLNKTEFTVIHVPTLAERNCELLDQHFKRFTNPDVTLTSTEVQALIRVGLSLQHCTNDANDMRRFSVALTNAFSRMPEEKYDLLGGEILDLRIITIAHVKHCVYPQQVEALRLFHCAEKKGHPVSLIKRCTLSIVKVIDPLLLTDPAKRLKRYSTLSL